jgi:hypothetical protein
MHSTNHTRYYCLQVGQCDRGPRPSRYDFSFGIVGVGLNPQAYLGTVSLYAVHQVFNHPGGLTQANQQHAFSRGVQAAGVSNSALTGQSADYVYDIMGSQTRRFMDIEYAIYEFNQGLATTPAQSGDRTATTRWQVGYLAAVLIIQVESLSVRVLRTVSDAS